MCSASNFVLLDGYFSQSVQMDPSAGMVIGGPAVPTVAIACTNCGFISHHALGALGLLPTQSAGVAK